MPYKVNPFVELLAGHVPLGANSGELYEERAQDLDDGIDTAAKRFVLGLIAQPQLALIVLTGDAGHGKTHLCRRIVEDYGYEARSAMDRMENDPEGNEPIEDRSKSGRRPLRIIKDLSHIEPVSRAAQILGELAEDPLSVAIVCANEGRLRDVLDVAESEGAETVGKTLTAGIETGVTSLDGAIHVVNLNFQSVTSPRGSFLDGILRRWTQDRRRWRTCSKCDAVEWCPIKSNQLLLGGDDELGVGSERRRSGLVELVRVVERSGHVLTIRQCLALVAYLVTGGLDCREVADRSREIRRARLGFVDLLFHRRLTNDEARRLGVVARIRRFDPGKRAIRRVDDELQEVLDQEDMGAEYRAVPPPRTARERRRRADERRERFRDARRDDFFTMKRSDEVRSRRLGLRYYEDFELAIDPDARGSERWLRIRDRLIAGLHIIQGIRPRSNNLYVVDPAFGSAKGAAAILARRIRGTEIGLMSRRDHWMGETTRQDRIVDSVDWLERVVVVRFGSGTTSHLDLDLLQFEFVMRAGGGVAFRGFNGPDIRRVLAQLAALTDESYEDGNTEIEILDSSSLRTIQVDVGGQIRVGEP